MKKDIKYFKRLLEVNSIPEILRKFYYLNFLKRNTVFNIKLKTGLQMVLPSNDFGLSKDIFAKRIREEKGINFYLNNIDSNDVVLDVGANMGYFVIHAAKKTKMVYAIEPVETSLCFCGVNCFINNISNFKLFNFVAGKENKDTNFFVSRYFNLSSVEQRVDNNIDLGYQEIFLSMKTIDAFELDEGVNANVLRMDTEGFEVDILRGAHNFLGKENVCLFLEVHKVFIGSKGVMEICDLLLEKGFRVGYVCDDDKVNPNAEFRKIGLEELKSEVACFPDVFHLFVRKERC